MTDAACPICGGTSPPEALELREMMFGTRASFPYLRCPDCGTFRIEHVPADLRPYYPPAYYAFSAPDSIPDDGWITRTLNGFRSAPRLFGRGYRAARIAGLRVAPIPEVRTHASMLSLAGVRGYGDPIVDVGCGSRPFRLAELRRIGFTSLLGLEPFLAEPGPVTFHGIPIRRQELTELPGSDRFQLVMFHHSFEHIATPRATLEAAARLLRPGGTCLIRTPLADGALWDRYGVDWVELDPPRHLFLFTRKALVDIARRVGLELVAEVDDSGAWEFIASEQYRRDIAMNDDDSWFSSPERSPISEADVAAFKAEARELNLSRTAGRAGFYLRKPGPGAPGPGPTGVPGDVVYDTEPIPPAAGGTHLQEATSE